MDATAEYVHVEVVRMAPAYWLFVLLFVTGVVIAIATTWAARRRVREQHRWDVKVCPRCGANQPSHASYCRACGQRV